MVPDPWASLCPHPRLFPNGAPGPWSRFLVKQVSAEAAGAIDYGWYKLNVFTAWYRHIGRTIVSIFDPPPSAKEVTLHRLLCGLHVELLGHLFWTYVRLVEDVVSL